MILGVSYHHKKHSHKSMHYKMLANLRCYGMRLLVHHHVGHLHGGAGPAQQDEVVKWAGAVFPIILDHLVQGTGHGSPDACSRSEQKINVFSKYQCPHISVQRHALLSNIRLGVSDEGKIQWDYLDAEMGRKVFGFEVFGFVNTFSSIWICTQIHFWCAEKYLDLSQIHFKVSEISNTFQILFKYSCYFS